ncbi:hypothetical protein BGZ95_007731, partial [Linnemannia exigua]
MGCRNLWKFFANKNHIPKVRYLRHQCSALKDKENKIRVDVQGSIFATIRFAYSHCNSLDSAHAIVLKKIEKLASRSQSVLYLDGDPTLEKQHTHQVREETRAKALAAANKLVDNFVDRVDNNLRIPKQLFKNINKELNKAFRWEPEIRRSLAQYLRINGWSVVESDGEADTHIALDYVAGDIVDVLSTLSIQRAQLTALGVVSYNDYNTNIFGLGCATNFEIFKSFKKN